MILLYYTTFSLTCGLLEEQPKLSSMQIGLCEFFCLIPFKLAQMCLWYVYFAHPNFLSAHTALSLSMIPLVGSARVKLYSAYANTALGLSLPFSALLIVHHHVDLFLEYFAISSYSSYHAIQISTPLHTASISHTYCYQAPFTYVYFQSSSLI